jgi:hypothetical protein
MSSTGARPVEGLTTNIRHMLARGITLRRQIAEGNIQVLDCDPESIILGPGIQDEGDYLFHMMVELVAECSQQGEVLMTPIRTIFSFFKFLIHASRIILNNDYKTACAKKLDVIRPSLIFEFYTSLKLKEHVSKAQILAIAESYMNGGKIQDATSIIIDFELF